MREVSMTARLMTTASVDPSARTPRFALHSTLLVFLSLSTGLLVDSTATFAGCNRKAIPAPVCANDDTDGCLAIGNMYCYCPKGDFCLTIGGSLPQGEPCFNYVEQCTSD